MRRSKLLVALLIGSILFQFSCGVKPVGGSGKIGKYVESFYKKDGMLYFVKPIEFYNGKNKILADFTYSKNDSIMKPVIANLSIYGTPPFKLPQKVTFTFNNETVSTESIKLLHNNATGRKTFSRITTELPYGNFESFLLSENTDITLQYGTEQRKYSSGKTWRKSHKKIHQLIFW